MINSILVGNVFEVIKSLPDDFVDCVVTSPPYWGMRNYGTYNWEGGNPECNHDSALVKNRYDYSMGEIQRAYDNANAKLYKDVCPDCGARKIDYQLGNEPTYQEYLDKMIQLFAEIKRVLKTSGSVWVNLGDTYSTKPIGIYNGKSSDSTASSGDIDKTKSGIPNKSQIMVPERFAIRMIDDLGYIKRNTVIWHKPNPFPTSVLDRFTNDFEYIFFFTKSPRYYFEQQLEPAKSSTIERLKYGLGETKYNKEGIVKGGINTLAKPREAKPLRERDRYRNKRCVWTIPTASSEGKVSGDHVAPYPEKLIETPIVASCPEGGIVLDPFMGSGTTGVVAKKFRRNFIGIELNQRYAENAMIRINSTQEFLF